MISSWSHLLTTEHLKDLVSGVFLHQDRKNVGFVKDKFIRFLFGMKELVRSSILILKIQVIL